MSRGRRHRSHLIQMTQCRVFGFRMKVLTSWHEALQHFSRGVRREKAGPKVTMHGTELPVKPECDANTLQRCRSSEPGTKYYVFQNVVFLTSLFS